jgi:DinB superfamily
MDEKILREHIRKVLGWGEAHVDWKTALADFPAKDRGVRSSGAPHSAWELLEHVRIAQWDMLEFSRNPKHVSPKWPSGYWPESPTPPDAAAWEKSVKAFEKDLKAMEELVSDPHTDLCAAIPHGSGQTILREAFLVADHNSYHLGQFVLLRRLLAAWSKS